MDSRFISYDLLFLSINQTSVWMAKRNKLKPGMLDVRWMQASNRPSHYGWEGSSWWSRRNEQRYPFLDQWVAISLIRKKEEEACYPCCIYRWNRRNARPKRWYPCSYGWAAISRVSKTQTWLFFLHEWWSYGPHL